MRALRQPVLEPDRGRPEAGRHDRATVDRIGVRILGIEGGLLECLAAGACRVRDHVSELRRDIEIAAAVVPDVEHEILDPQRLELGNGGRQLSFGWRIVIVEQDVADLRSRRARDHRRHGHRVLGHDGRRQRPHLDATVQLLNAKRMTFARRAGREPRVEHIDARLRAVVDADTVDGDDLVTATQVGGYCGLRRIRLNECDGRVTRRLLPDQR